MWSAISSHARLVSSAASRLQAPWPGSEFLGHPHLYFLSYPESAVIAGPSCFFMLFGYSRGPYASLSCAPSLRYSLFIINL